MKSLLFTRNNHGLPGYNTPGWDTEAGIRCSRQAVSGPLNQQGPLGGQSMCSAV